MEYGLYNISDENVHTLVAQDSGAGRLTSINICNAAAVGAKVRLFLSDGTNDTSIVENVVVPSAVSLFLDEGLSFNTSVLALKIQIEDAAGGSTVDANIIIK